MPPLRIDTMLDYRRLKPLVVVDLEGPDSEVVERDRVKRGLDFEECLQTQVY